MRIDIMFHKAERCPTEAIERPIVIVGQGRCGSTFVQHLLSAHPDCAIAGQFPSGDFPDWLIDVEARLIAEGNKAAEANRRIGYDVAHYAGSPPVRSRELFSCLLQKWLTGFCLPPNRWGIKGLSLGYRLDYRQAWLRWFPESQFVFCLRDPFDSFESCKATFGRDERLRPWLEQFVQMVSLIRPQDHVIHVACIQPEDRVSEVARLLVGVGLEWDAALESFVDRWPRIHRVTNDRVYRLDVDRDAAIDSVAGLRDAIVSVRTQTAPHQQPSHQPSTLPQNKAPPPDLQERRSGRKR